MLFILDEMLMDLVVELGDINRTTIDPIRIDKFP